MWKRAVYDLLVLISVFFLPFWITAILLIAGTILFPWFIELFFFSVLVDRLFGIPELRFFNFQYVVTVFALILFVIYQLIRPRLKHITL